MKLLKALVALIAVASVQAVAPGAFTPFAGQWKGSLVYQDYRGSGRVSVPVRLEVRVMDATHAAWDFTYDDFGRTVVSLETHTWAGGRYTVQYKGKSEAESYTSSDLAELLRRGSGQAVLKGSELDGGKPAEVRRTITLEADRLVTLKEVRVAGGAFSFRNQSTYVRQP